MNETETLHAFMAEVPYALPFVRVFRRNIVNAAVEVRGRRFQARAGEKGMADAYAIVEGGRHVEIEAKSARGKLSREQVAWRDQMQRMRVPYLLLQILQGEAPADTVRRWIEELREVAT